MNKKYKILSFILFIFALLPFYTFSINAKTLALPTTAKVLINGRQTDFRAYNINGSNFFRLRDLAYALNNTNSRFDISWNETLNEIMLRPGMPYRAIGSEMAQRPTFASVTAIKTESNISLFNAPINLTGYNIDASNYFMLREIGFYIGFDVDWDEQTSTILIDTNEPFITNQGKNAAIEFLSEFTSLFSFGYLGDSDALVTFEQSGSNVIYRDKSGNILNHENTRFLLNEFMSAYHFELFDLDDDGIPEIIVRYGLPQSGWITSVLYRYINGEFVQIYVFNNSIPTFYRDMSDRLIWLYDSDMHGLFYYFYSEFDRDKVNLEVIYDPEESGFDWDLWHNHHQSVDFFTNPTIFGTDTPIKRIRPMVAYQNEISDIILERLGLTR